MVVVFCAFEGCNRKALPIWGEFCSRSHRKLHKRKPAKITLFCANCDRPVVRNPSQVSEGGKAYCSRCPKNSGENHPNWKQGQYVNPAGYRLILHKNAYVLEHRRTWELANNSCILPQAHGIVHVHHINMNKLDNRSENLVLLTSHDHGRIHRLMDAGKFGDAQKELHRCTSQQVFFLDRPDKGAHDILIALEQIRKTHPKHALQRR